MILKSKISSSLEVISPNVTFQPLAEEIIRRSQEE